MRRVLIVDDEEKIRNIYMTLLADEGYDVLSSSNVSDAYNILLNNDIDLIILDIRMPGEGNILYEVLRFMRNRSRVLVASVYPLDTQQSLIPDAEGYFDKSSGLDVLLRKIKSILT
ncbi:MAG TPA: response regulator [Spirochaetota bacterium]|nr:response regulator [Spirochaetota bacterium]